MKHVLTIFILLGSCAYGYYAYTTGEFVPSTIALGDFGSAHEITSTDLEGFPISLDERLSESDMVMLLFWNTNCGVCRTELQTLATIYDEAYEAGLDILTVSVDSRKAPVEKFIAANDIPFPVVMDDRFKLAETYNVDFMPMSFFIDADGTIRKIMRGYNPGDLKTIKKIIRHLSDG